MLTLYHNKGAVCAQKVRLTLAEKRLEWRSVEVDFANQPFMEVYRRELNPQGVVPTLLVGAVPLVESNVIMQWLDESYPSPHLSPADAIERARMRVWLTQIDIDIHTSINALSFAVAFRARFQDMPPERREAVYAAIPDAERRARRRELVDHGLGSPLVGYAVARFMRLFAEMERALTHHGFLVGGDYSLADIALTPYFERLTALGFHRIWHLYPHLSQWWDTMQARENYAEAITGWGGAGVRSEIEPLADAAWPVIATLIKAAG